MSDRVALDNAYSALERYVKHFRRGSGSFTTNDIREKLSWVPSLKPSQISSVVNRAIHRGLITARGTTRSNDSYHHGGRVSLYSRLS